MPTFEYCLFIYLHIYFWQYQQSGYEWVNSGSFEQSYHTTYVFFPFTFLNRFSRYVLGILQVQYLQYFIVYTGMTRGNTSNKVKIALKYKTP